MEEWEDEPEEASSEEGERRQLHREASARSRAQETPQQRDSRLARLRERLAEREVAESEAEAADRLGRHSESEAQSRAQETPEQRAARLAWLRERLAEREGAESEADAADRVRRDQESKAARADTPHRLVLATLEIEKISPWKSRSSSAYLGKDFLSAAYLWTLRVCPYHRPNYCNNYLLHR